MSTARSDKGGRSARRGTTPSDLDMVEELVGLSEYDPTATLSCAAWTDPAFCDAVLTERWEQKHRTKAREPGLDADKVTEHCLQARAVRATAGGWFLAIAIVMCAFHMVVGAFALGLAAFLALTGSILSGNGGLGGLVARWGLGKLIAIGLLISVMITILLPMLSMGAAFTGQSAFDDSFTTQPSPMDADPHQPQGPPTFGFLIPFWVALPVMFLGMVIPGAWARGRRNSALWDIRQKARVHRAKIGRAPSGGPVSFYSSYMPFVGAGVPVHSWPVTLDLRAPRAAVKGKGEGGSHPVSPAVEGNGHGDPRTADSGSEAVDPPKSTVSLISGTALVEAVYDRLRSGLPELSEGGSLLTASRTRVEVADSVFLPGSRTKPPKNLSGDLYKTGTRQLDPEWRRRILAVSHERARHFLEIGVSMWERQLIVTFFVRVTVQGGLLHIEGETLVMPPVSPRYGVPTGDLLKPDSVDEYIGLLWQAGTGLATDLRDNLNEVGARLRAGRAARVHEEEHTWARENKDLFDYSPRRGVREMAAIDRLDQLFQSHDLRRVTRAVPEKVLVCVREVLESAGYDTGQVARVIQNFTAVENQVLGDQNVNGGNVGIGRVTFDQKTVPSDSRSKERDGV